MRGRKVSREQPDRTWWLSLAAPLAILLLVASGGWGRAERLEARPSPPRDHFGAVPGIDQVAGPRMRRAAANDDAHTPGAATAGVDTRAQTLLELARRGRVLIRDLEAQLRQWETALTPQLKGLEEQTKRAEEAQRRQQQLEQELANLRGSTERLLQERTALMGRTQTVIAHAVRSWPRPPQSASPTPPRPPGATPLPADITAAQESRDETKYYVVANTKPPDAFLGLRTHPSSSIGKRIEAMPNGTALEVLNTNPDGWWYVRVVASGNQGWALSGQKEKRWIVCCVNSSSVATTAGQHDVQQMIQSAMTRGGMDNEEEILAAKRRIEARRSSRLTDPGARRQARAANEQGRSALQESRVAEAVQAFQAAYTADPTDVEIITNLGYAYLFQGDLQTAEPWLLRALVVSPGRSIAWANLGHVYAAQGNLRVAVACFAHAYRFALRKETMRKSLEILARDNKNDQVREAARQALQLPLVQATKN